MLMNEGVDCTAGRNDAAGCGWDHADTTPIEMHTDSRRKNSRHDEIFVKRSDLLTRSQ